MAHSVNHLITCIVFMVISVNMLFYINHSKTYVHKTTFDIEKEDIDANKLGQMPCNGSFFKRNELTTRMNISKPNVIVMVLSARSNFERRQIIRETWAKNHSNVLFFISDDYCFLPDEYRLNWTCIHNGDTINPDILKTYLTKEKKIDKLLLEENMRFNDTVILPITEAYRNLPLKVKYGYDWIIKHSSVQWILKADDDSVVWVHNLEKLIVKHNLKKLRNKYTVIGRIVKGWPVIRTGKWTENHYKPDKYPSFATGSTGHLVSRAIATYIATNKNKLHNYQGEDTSIGIWIHESPFRRKTKWLNSSLFVKDGNCYKTDRVVVGHDISPTMMRDCFQSYLYNTTLAKENVNITV